MSTPALRERGGDLAEDHVQLDQGCAAQAVDDDDRAVARGERLVGEDRVEGDRDDLLGGTQLARGGGPARRGCRRRPRSRPRAGRSRACRPRAWCRRSARRRTTAAVRSPRGPPSATVVERRPARRRRRRPSRRSTVAPVPRRPAVQVVSCTATSSSTTTVTTSTPVSAGQFGGHLEVQHVAGVVLHDVHHAGAGVDGLGRRRASGPGTGEVNTSPQQAASSMPRPTKPPCSGS